MKTVTIASSEERYLETIRKRLATAEDKLVLMDHDVWPDFTREDLFREDLLGAHLLSGCLNYDEYAELLPLLVRGQEQEHPV